LTARDHDWRPLAACWDTFDPAFFPQRGGYTADNNRAKTLCQTCQVQVECLDYAVATRPKYGIWGGETERGLRVARRQRRAVA
jgi:WhiB family redox-sensing transcriptional regulator